jgi:hypothetical protein
MKTIFEDRPIDIEELENATFDYDYWCDAFISQATWLDTNKEFTDEELDRINDKGIDEYIIQWLY